MTTQIQSEEYCEIDEAEEEALLKSDEDGEDDAVGGNAIGVAEDSLIGFVDNDESMKSQSGEQMDSNDSNDSESENSDDDTAQQNIVNEYKILLEEVKVDKYAYNKYVRLCELSHKTEDLFNIRTAHELFSNVYPLTPQIWMRYIKCEAGIAQSSEELQKLNALFRKAFDDYYSTDIAFMYIELCTQLDFKKIWNEILGVYGLHCMKGREYFSNYRLFLTNNNNISKEEKREAFIDSYLRELKLPLFNMEESYIEFKTFCTVNKDSIEREIDWKIIDKFYFKAKEHMQKIVPYENKLINLDPKFHREKAEIYLNYIKDSDKFLDENVLQTVYERMVADCCLDQNCWAEYISFLEYRDEFGRPKEMVDFPLFQQNVIDVTNRALRNCPWNEKLYVKRLHLLEKMKRSRAEIKEVFESSLTAGFQSAQSMVAIWLAYLSYMRRHINWENEDECDILRKNFNWCWTSLGQLFGVLADCDCEILQFWGRLEYGPLGQPKEGKSLWNTVMESSDNSKKAGLWIEFIQLEMRRDLDSARRLFRKALHTEELDNPYVIISAWQRFERCNGSLKHLEECTKECEKYMSQLWQKQELSTSESTAKPNRIKGTKRKFPNQTDPDEGNNVFKKQRSADRPAKELSNEKAPTHKSVDVKENESQDIDYSKDNMRIFLSNLDFDLTEKDILEGFPELSIDSIDLIRTNKGRSRGFAYLQLKNEKAVQQALGFDRRPLNGRPVFISTVLRDEKRRQKFKYSETLEPKKLFIKNLPQDVTKEEVTKLFESFGAMEDVRLVYQKNGNFKGIAYIDFEREKSAQKAVMSMDQHELRGRSISVAISAPPPKPTLDELSRPSSSSNAHIPSGSRKVFDQKPRMSFIPMAVQKRQIEISMPPPKPLPSSSSSVNGAAKATTKTNEDFRKLLQRT